MRFPKDFKRNGGNRYQLEGTKIFVLQWNTGKNKNFMVEKCDNKTQPIKIPGKGDEAMMKAIETAYGLRREPT